jgi:hypothetical protein
LVAASVPATGSSLTVEANQLPLPSIDSNNFNQRFEAVSGADTLAARFPHFDGVGGELNDSNVELSGEAAGTVNGRRERAVHSPISVFSFDPAPALPAVDLTTGPRADGDRSAAPARADLLLGVPEDYAALAVAIAAEEEVDPNWVLSIMRAENAGFDRELVSPAGAIGLMQVMPKIGEAFGARDLTDPEQNIRAGTRFLRVLIGKYRNPVLIASAYNAGEPRVDVHRSLPLIRETADYVTRVVGYYTGAAMTSQALTPGPSSRSEPNRPRRSGPADRAKSPMLVFSVPDPLASAVRLRRTDEAAQFSGPVKIVKEEVLQ